jgi:ABC-type sugar transport system substrate-binding protein
MRRGVPFSINKTKSTGSRLVRRRRISARAACLFMLAGALLGCDSFSFVPPKPEDLRESAGAVPAAVTDTFRPPTAAALSPAQSKSIDVVLGPHEADEAEVWKGAIRVQAGLDRAQHRTLGPAEPPSTQATLVREAVARHPGVLVVEASAPVDPPLREAIEEARNQGIPVVVVGRTLAGGKTESKAAGAAETKSAGSAPQPAPLFVVAPKPLEESAKQLVTMTLRACRNADIDPGKTTILISSSKGGPFVDECTIAIKDALKAAGLTTIDELRFAVNDKQSVAAVTANLKANPKTVTIFAVDSMTSGVIRDFVKDDASHRFIVAGCYASDEFKSDLTRLVQIGAIAEFAPTRLLRKGISTAASIAQGRDVQRLIEFPINVTESLASPAMLKAQAIQWQKTPDGPQLPNK